VTGIERIAAERARQIAKEGWTPEHDDDHDLGELALVGALYATPVRLFEKLENPNGGVAMLDPWPDTWDRKWDKRGPRRLTGPRRIRELEKAGALIAAEIDRLLRRQPKASKDGTP
jgi:hypothetical protein